MMNILLFVVLSYHLMLAAKTPFKIWAVWEIILKSCNLSIELHKVVKEKDPTTLHRNTTSDSLKEDSMDLVRFFLVSYHWLVGVSTNVIPCKDFSLFAALKTTTSKFWSSVMIQKIIFRSALHKHVFVKYWKWVRFFGLYPYCSCYLWNALAE